MHITEQESSMTPKKVLQLWSMGKFHQVAITGVLALTIGITLALGIEL